MKSSSRFYDTTLEDLLFQSTERAEAANMAAAPIYGVDRSVGLTAEPKYAAVNVHRYKVLRPEMFAYNPMRLNIGSIGFCSQSRAPGLVSPDYVVFGCKPNKADPNFFNYFIQGPQWKRWTKAAGVGSVRVRIYYQEVAKMPVRVPQIEEQKEIGKILRTLDDKIELNRRMNATLQAIAQTLFSNWITVHKDQLRKSTVQELIQNNVLMIGDGYRAKNAEFSEDGLPFIRAGNLKADGLDLASAEVLRATSVAAAGNKVGRIDDVAFTSKGTVGRITRVSSKTGSFVYSPQVCFWRSTAPNQLNPNVLYRWMCTPEFTRQIAAVSTQTDMAPYVSLQDQRKMSIKLPPASAQQEIGSHLKPLDDRIAANAEQIRTLTNLRNTLLPKLLSGELSIRG